jgi:hypothetical protein
LSEEERKHTGDVKLGVKCAANYTLEDFGSNIGFRQGRMPSPASLNLLMDDVLRKLGEPNAHPPVHAGEEAIWIVDWIEVFCEEWELKVNVEKTKLLMYDFSFLQQ